MLEYSQGSIRKRRKSKNSDTWIWEAVIYVTDTTTYKQKQKCHSTGIECDPPTPDEIHRGKNNKPEGKGARQALNSLVEWRKSLVEAEEAKKLPTDNGDHQSSVLDFVDYYWSTRTVTTVTMYGYQKLRNVLDHKLLQVPIATLKPETIQKWINDALNDGVGVSTVIKAFSQLKYACAWGVRMQLLKNNPCDPVIPPKKLRSDPNPLNAQDISKLLVMLENMREVNDTRRAVADAALIALNTGMRLGEILGLRWSDIDGATDKKLQAGNLLHVRRTVTAPKGGLEIKDCPKNGKQRDIPLNQSLIRILQRRWDEIPSEIEVSERTNDYIISRRLHEHEFMSVGYISKEWSSFIASSGLRGANGTIPHFKDLRHTFATQALINGVDVATVAGILGHLNTSTTLTYYARWLPSSKSEAMRRMDTVIGR